MHQKLSNHHQQSISVSSTILVIFNNFYQIVPESAVKNDLEIKGIHPQVGGRRGLNIGPRHHLVSTISPGFPTDRSRDIFHHLTRLFLFFPKFLQNVTSQLYRHDYTNLIIKMCIQIIRRSKLYPLRSSHAE